MLRVRCYTETVETIIKFWCEKYPKMTLHKAVDMFSDVCQQHRNCAPKDKITISANLFIYACNILRCDILTGSQAFEIANSCAVDCGIDKNKMRKKINWQMYWLRKEK